MKKFICKSFLLAIALMLMRSPKAEAQFCPVQIYNNTTEIGIVSLGLYNAVSQSGVYEITMISSQMTPVLCWLVPGGGSQVTLTKSTDVLGHISGGASTGGWGVYFDVSAALAGVNCLSSLPVDLDPPIDKWDMIQEGSFSIELKPVSGQGGNITLAVNITDRTIDDCYGGVVPVIWGPFSTTFLTFPNRVRLDWTTYTEQDVNHFTIEKSIDGGTFYKIAEVAAVGNSTAQNNYQYTDNSPLSPRGYYRVVSVDNDCRRNYSLIRYANCSNCATTFTPPNITPDCTPPNTSPHITGPASICDNSAKLYRLNFVTGEAAVTWSISPSYLANLSGVSRLVGVVPTGNPGIGTLTATVVKNGVTSYYNYNITFGIPQIYGWCSSGPPDNCNGAYQFTAQVGILPGTSWSQYDWYQNGYFIGSGDQHTWYITQGSTVNFQVRYNSPCGTSYWIGSSNGCTIDPLKNGTASGNPTVAAPKIARPRFEIMPNPARSIITIMRPPPCNEPPLDPWKMKSSPVAAQTNETATVKIFDAQGKLRKTTVMSAASSKLTVNASDLPAGLYFVHVIEAGKETVTLKVLLEK